MVTSAHPGEGKTFVAANLALSIASERDIHVLLIDADVARPMIPTVFGFDGGQGLMDILDDESIHLPDVLVRTNIEGLTILPAGQYSRLAAELFASARMKRFVEDIAYRYKDRVIIFDSPPVLARTEPNVLGHSVGQIVFVVSAGQTTQSSVRQAVSLLDSEKIAGMVLNKLNPQFARERFGKYYGSYKHGDLRRAA
jgi:receptor protein-tyrosine kinase